MNKLIHTDTGNINNCYTIEKPWGKELIIALTDKYCYKRLYINEGHRTSLQYHNFKLETNYIISGRALVELGDGSFEATEGDFFTVGPRRKHRITALTDLVLQEVSTPEIDDVYRLADDTQRPNGRIEKEHNPNYYPWCILSAGKGGRLESLTSKINKALLPIGNRPVISYIIDKIPVGADIVISVGYQKDSLIEFCNAAYPERNFIFVDNPDYESTSTGPATGLLLCQEYLQRPFYFCCNDCIVDEDIPGLDCNWMGVQPTTTPEIYSTADVDALSNVINFQNKSPHGFPDAFIGIAGIQEYNIFWDRLNLTYNSGDVELVSAFYDPSIYKSLKAKQFTWHDTGNIEAYNTTVDMLAERSNIKKKLMK